MNNYTSCTKILKITRIILIFFVLATLIYLFYQSLVLSGCLIAESDFKNRSPFLSPLFPVNRVVAIKQDPKGFYYQTIFSEPVYFEMGIPTRFQKAKVYLEYQNTEQEIFRLGLRQSAQDWHYYTQPINNNKYGKNWQKAWVIFDLYPSFTVNHSLRFMFSAPGLDFGRREIKIRKIKVVLEKEPITRENFYPKIKNFSRRVKNKILREIKQIFKI